MLVVFEGIDGSGKTTLSNRVVERLGARGISVKHLRAGGRFVSSVTESIRSLGRDARNLDLVPEAEFLLYVAREVQLIEEALKPALLAHDVVFADRFLYTAEVLARFGRRLAPTWTEPVLRAAGGGVSPDLVVLMDVEPSLARARRKSHKRAVRDQRPPSRRGLAGVGLQYRLREGYLALARQHSDRWVVIDNDQPLEQAVASVSDLIEHALAHGAKASLASFRAPVLPSPVPSARATVSPRSAADALRGFVAWLEQRAELEPRVAAHMLSGLAGDAVDGLRRALIERVPEAVLFGLSGLVDPVSWEIRERLKSAHPTSVARTLQEIPNHDPRAAALRAELEPSASADVLASLSGLDDERAWQIRESWYERQQEAVVRSLVGLDGVRAWQLRERWLGAHLAALGSEYELARTASRSVAGVPGERAFEVREAAALAAPVAALSSIAGLSCERSFQWRERYLVRAPKPVMATLRGMRTARAWQMRVAVAADCKEALDSIVALGEPEAWSLRESYADVWPSTVVKSLGVLADSERGRALLERQLSAHGANVSLLKHASAIALGVHDMVSLDD